ncbi:DUF2946 domain-containing protein [Pseudomonas sp. LS1212]|uniref:DUF2946 domain-containing protein n=1 Tax=Pseudomonas sp. LS1212 TaxID=2972478 RepID=UPI00215D4A22|nr:DUF2946 domain-containing protein [Pseudomonas sp. LS1212]UVJ44544.1 DUF2946 domain-containing protein [Pseudomonas sp. LS1212]
MPRHRLAYAWIACFAVLFNMLAMPLSGASPQAEQLLWGSFCSGSGTRLVALSLGQAEQNAPQNNDHSTMQHCWCCSGSTPLVALPGHAARLILAYHDVTVDAPTASAITPTPRQQWPSLNPRASPLA